MMEQLLDQDEYSRTVESARPARDLILGLSNVAWRIAELAHRWVGRGRNGDVRVLPREDRPTVDAGTPAIRKLGELINTIGATLVQCSLH